MTSKLSIVLLFSSSLLADSAEIVPVKESKLPQGKGKAKATDLIFADDFESSEKPGSKWDEARNEDTVLSLVDPKDARCGKKCLKSRGDIQKNTGGGVTKWFESADRLFIRFYAKFDKDCDYVHHFVTLRANKSLRGGDKWSGFGGAGQKPKGDSRFSTALEPWGNWGRYPAPGRWGFYTYWHEMTKSRDGKYWGNHYHPDKQPNIEKGKWICCEFMVKHNTPGKTDGEQAFWIDGKLMGHWKGYNWRTNSKLRANALSLESYITDRWTKNRFNTVYFDNVVVASEYVGPVKD